jgi:hypothetical protein
MNRQNLIGAAESIRRKAEKLADAMRALLDADEREAQRVAELRDENELMQVLRGGGDEGDSVEVAKRAEREKHLESVPADTIGEKAKQPEPMQPDTRWYRGANDGTFLRRYDKTGAWFLWRRILAWKQSGVDEDYLGNIPITEEEAMKQMAEWEKPCGGGDEGDSVEVAKLKAEVTHLQAEIAKLKVLAMPSVEELELTVASDLLVAANERRQESWFDIGMILKGGTKLRPVEEHEKATVVRRAIHAIHAFLAEREKHLESVPREFCCEYHRRKEEAKRTKQPEPLCPGTRWYRGANDGALRRYDKTGAWVFWRRILAWKQSGVAEGYLGNISITEEEAMKQIAEWDNCTGAFCGGGVK